MKRGELKKQSRKYVNERDILIAQIGMAIQNLTVSPADTMDNLQQQPATEIDENILMFFLKENKRKAKEEQRANDAFQRYSWIAEWAMHIKNLKVEHAKTMGDLKQQSVSIEHLTLSGMADSLDRRYVNSDCRHILEMWAESRNSLLMMSIQNNHLEFLTTNHHMKAHRSRDRNKLVEQTYFEPSKLYNMLLEYKRRMCSLVVLNERVKSLQRIDVYRQNDYPCIMVQVREHIFKNEKDARKNLDEIIILFTAIANRIADEKKVPIKLRSSRPRLHRYDLRYAEENGERSLLLGQNHPSVSGTKNSFKINIGLVPKVYATEVLVESLRRLDEITEESWNSKSQDVHSSENSLKDEHKQIKDDRIFWNLINKVKNGLDDYHCDHKEEQNLSGKLFDFDLSEKKLHGLYETLNYANFSFVVHSLLSDDNETGYGSDSDCEFEISANDPRYYSKKIITSTGTKAIEFATICSKLLCGDDSEINTQFMHHKTREIIDHVWPDTLKTENSRDKHKKMMYIDLNYCSFNRNHEELHVDLQKIQKEMKDLGGSKNEVIVFDITSAKTEKVRKAVHLFAPHVNVVLLVSNGSENEQIGADMNPYGTIRIISDDRSTVVGLFEALRATFSCHDKLPNYSHSIRTEYKRIGAVLTTEAFCDDALHFRERDGPISKKDSRKIEEFTRRMRKLFDEQEEYESHNMKIPYSSPRRVGRRRIVEFISCSCFSALEHKRLGKLS